MRILIIQLRRIGDILVTTPVVDALREKFPDAVIDFLVEPMGEPVLRHHPGLNEILLLKKESFFPFLLDIRRRRYDWVLDFLNTPRSAQVALASGAGLRAGFETPFWGRVYTHRVPRSTEPKHIVEQKFDLLRSLGIFPRPALPVVHLVPEDSGDLESWWAEGPGKFAVKVGAAPAHRHPVRMWPERHWAALFPALLSRPERAILLFGGPGEEPLLERLAAPHPGRIFVVPVGPWRRAPALMARCGVVLSNCSGSMHAAVAAGVPTVTMYGPSMPEVWNPRRPPHRFLQADGLSCLGCRRNECPFGHECLEWLSPERVARETEAVLS